MECKYCGNKTTKGMQVCAICYGKIDLVRQLRGMVQNAKDQVEREKRIQEDIRKVRRDG